MKKPRELQLRAIAAFSMPDVKPNTIVDAPPTVRLVDPTALKVDEDYQRNLSDRSVSLIRKIVATWDWRSFKPPIVMEVEGDLHIIDGQHTAIAAASHPGVAQIPVVVAPAGAGEDRAMAFVRHNRDRLQVTATQLHHSLVAAGDEDAMTVQQVCDRAGVRILRHPPSYARFAPGDTMAVQALAALVGRRYAKGAREVLQVCAESKIAPITSNAIKAVEELLFGVSYAGQVAAADIATTMRELDIRLEKDAKRFAAEHDLPIWKGMVVTIFRKTTKVRHGRSAAA